MGPFHLAPSYEYTPGSRLPPRKVYVLHGTKGYELEDVVCGEDATAGQRGRVASGSCNLGCQKTGGIEGSEGDGKERKGKSVREEVDTEREYEIRRESEKQENLFIEGVKPVVGLKNPHFLSLVDIECDIPRTGLGPEMVESLGLEEVDIGLKNHVILQDYISPPGQSDGPLGSSLIS